MVASPPPKSGRAHAEFDLLQEVGRGSYGVVQKACRKRDGKVCVVKSVLLERLGTERERTLALNEAKIMKELKCPHIVEYLDAFTDRGTLYLVLELCELGNLKAHYLRSAAPIGMPRVWRIGLRITMGLEYLHDLRVLHRDVKSENILLMPEDGVRIADLGLAKQLSNSVVATTMCGTPRYLSPEMAKGAGPYSEKCDIWALGIILYEMCSMDHGGPFKSNALTDLLHKIQFQAIPALPRRTDPPLRDLVILQLLQKDPAARPTASQVLALPGVVDRGTRHGALEQRPASSDTRESPASVPSSGQDRPAGASTPCDASAGLLSEQTVPDGLCSQLGRILGRGSTEPALGQRFRRLGHCELCAAQGLPGAEFGLLRRRHHCRNCGRSVCAAHSSRQQLLTHLGHRQPQRICDLCGLVPQFGCEDDGGSRSRDWMRPWILTARNGAQALAWDSSSLSAAAWSTPEKLLWMGHGHDSAGTVVCMLSSHAGACLQTRALETGEAIRSIALPLAAGGQVSAATPSHGSHADRPSSGGTFTPAGRALSVRLSRAATVDAAACCGEWFAAARRDWANSFVHVLGLTCGSCLGYCALQDKVTAMAVQDGPEGFVAAGLHSGEVCIWDVPGVEEPCPLRCRLEGHRQSVTCIAVARDHGVICSGSSNCLRLWRRQSNGSFQLNSYPEACDDHVATGSAAICCTGGLLAFVCKPRQGTWERGVSLWDLGLGRFERSFYKKGHSVGCVALCGDLLVTSDSASPRGGCTIQLWYAHTGTPLAVFRNPGPVNQLLAAAARPPEPRNARQRR